MTDKEIIQALRICATHKDKGCGLCPQRKYVRCTERLADEAITMIERLTAKNVILPDGQASAIESLRKEIEWKDMVIALAQRKQAEAEAERDAMRERVPQWVSVKDRLPDCAVPVLVTYIGYDGNRHGDDVATRIDDWWLWWDGDLRSSDERVTVKITHWMPLPEAPEEGEKA